MASGSAMPTKKPAPDAIKKRDHTQSVPAYSPRSKIILGLDNQHGIYREKPIFHRKSTPTVLGETLSKQS
jgi:hypothetical protein